MGIELGAGKQVHEPLVHVEFDVGDGVPDGHDPVECVWIGQHELRAFQ